MAASLFIPGYVRAVCDDDGAVLLDLNRGKYFSLNGTAARIWNAIESGDAISDIEVRLRELPGADLRHVHDELASFVAALQRAELVEVRDHAD